MHCTPKGLHAPRYKIWFQGSPSKSSKPPTGHQRLFNSQSKMTHSLALSIEINNVYDATHSLITLTRVSYSNPTPSFAWNGGTEVIYSCGNLFYTCRVFLPRQARMHAPWVPVTSLNHSPSSGARTVG